MLRKTMVPLVVAIALLLPAALVVSARPAVAADDVTVSGEVIDMACYIGHDAHGPDHKQCAVKCAQMGQPLGLLSPDGKVYLLVADHADKAPYEKVRTMAGDKATIKGESGSKNGITSLSVKEVK